MRKTYDEINTGMTLRPLEIGPRTVAHIVRWCAAQENWERHHFDYKYATAHDGLPDVVDSGNWRKYAVTRLFKDWAGQDGWLWKLFMRYTGMHFPGDTFNIWAKVTDKYKVDGLGFVKLEGGMSNQEGKETTPTIAIVVLPLSGGKEVPYPFVPPPKFQLDSPFKIGCIVEDTKCITETAKLLIGKENQEIESYDEVSKSELRRFSQAIPDPDPIYWDEMYASKTRFGILVAPPLYPEDAFKLPPSSEDYLTMKLKENINFWGGPPGDPRLFPEIPLKVKIGSTMNGGQEFEILQLARLGEKLRAKYQLLALYEKESRTLGRIVVEEGLTTYKNSEGNLLLKSYRHRIHF